MFQNAEYWSCQPAFTKNLINVKITYAFVISGSTDGSYYEDDVNRARATKVEFNTETNQYDNIPSGVDGNTYTLNIKNRGNFDGNLVYNPPTSAGETIRHHVGNNDRTTDKCRIRAVYRSGTK